jgi:hypothetical protein
LFVFLVLVSRKAMILSIEKVQPALGGHPEITPGVFVQVIHAIISKTVRIVRLVTIMGERMVAAVETIQSSTKSADPKRPVLVFINAVHEVMAQSFRIRRIVPETRKLIVPGVEPVQTIISTDPEMMIAVFVDKADIIVAYAIRIPWVVPVNRHLITIIPVQAIAGTEPHESAMILENNFDGTVGQTLFVGNMFE